MCCGAASQGPFSVEFIKQSKSSSFARTMYTFEVRGWDGEHQVERRLADFASLCDGMGENLLHEMPEMPPKSFLRLKERTCAMFRSRRVLRLKEIIRFVMLSDPHAVMPATRRFLGLDAMSSELAVNARQLRQLLTLDGSMRIRTIVEGDDQEREENSCSECFNSEIVLNGDCESFSECECFNSTVESAEENGHCESLEDCQCKAASSGFRKFVTQLRSRRAIQVSRALGTWDAAFSGGERSADTLYYFQ